MPEDAVSPFLKCLSNAVNASYVDFVSAFSVVPFQTVVQKVLLGFTAGQEDEEEEERKSHHDGGS